MPSESELFMVFFKKCVELLISVQIKFIKVILNLTGNGLVIRSHNTVAVSPKRVLVMNMSSATWQ